MRVSSQAGSNHLEHTEIQQLARRLSLGREHGGTLDDSTEESACTHQERPVVRRRLERLEHALVRERGQAGARDGACSRRRGQAGAFGTSFVERLVRTRRTHAHLRRAVAARGQVAQQDPNLGAHAMRGGVQPGDEGVLVRLSELGDNIGAGMQRRLLRCRA